MNGKKARLIRKQVYGDKSRRATEYDQTGHHINRNLVVFIKGKMMHIKQVFFGYEGTLRSIGLRRQYKDAKKTYKAVRQ
ncbi:MAG: hypothetical protein PHY29_02920 [Syntrophales bacterium]|nr:hypothetical protein [Syntrophales bacterium]